LRSASGRIDTAGGCDSVGIIVLLVEDDPDNLELMAS